MASLTLILPLPPNKANSRQHWAVALREKRAYQARLTVALQNSGKRPPKPLQRFSAHVMMYAKRVRDMDNAWASMKPLWDTLTRQGWIADDAPKHFLSGTMVSLCDDRNPRVEVCLTDLRE